MSMENEKHPELDEASTQRESSHSLSAQKQIPLIEKTAISDTFASDTKPSAHLKATEAKEVRKKRRGELLGSQDTQESRGGIQSGNTSRTGAAPVAAKKLSYGSLLSKKSRSSSAFHKIDKKLSEPKTGLERQELSTASTVEAGKSAKTDTSDVFHESAVSNTTTEKFESKPQPESTTVQVGKSNSGSQTGSRSWMQ